MKHVVLDRLGQVRDRLKQVEADLTQIEIGSDRLRQVNRAGDSH